MRLRYVVTLACVAALFLLHACVTTQEVEYAQGSPESEVWAQIKLMETAWAKGDVEGIANLIAEDGEIYDGDSKTAMNKEAYMKTVPLKFSKWSVKYTNPKFGIKGDTVEADVDTVIRNKQNLQTYYYYAKYTWVERDGIYLLLRSEPR